MVKKQEDQLGGCCVHPGGGNSLDHSDSGGLGKQ